MNEKEANLACLTERKQQTTEMSSVDTAAFRSSFVQCDEKYLKKLSSTLT